MVTGYLQKVHNLLASNNIKLVSPKGIEGEYPIKYKDLKLIQNTDTDAIVQISGKKTIIRKVYLKRLIKQDHTGIWTVVGYEPI